MYIKIQMGAQIDKNCAPKKDTINQNKTLQSQQQINDKWRQISLQ